MKYKEVMQELESMGTAQNRKVYSRHGVGPKMFGVSYANLGKLRKRIKLDHELALKLWRSGNHDARVLATMVADPSQMTSAMLDSWARELDNYVLTDAFSSVALKSPSSQAKMKKWTRSKNEWTSRAGWHVLTGLARHDGDLTNEDFENYLEKIESDIHSSKNRVRDAMNNALIAIALRNGSLERKAIAAAKRIGKVDVDHGETGCKTPDAADYIARAKAHKRRKKRA